MSTETTPDDASPLWCADDAPHGAHSRTNQFGGTDYCTGRPDPEPDDADRAEADRAEADRLWFSGEHGSPVDWRGGYVRGRADERAQAEGAGSSLSTQEGYEWLVDHDKQVRAHERARIAARRDKAEEAIMRVRDAYPRRPDDAPSDEVTDAVLAALGVDR